MWDKVLSDTSIPNDTRWAMISGFWAQARTTPSAYVGYVGEYFEALAGIWERFTFHTAEDLTTLLFPTSLAGYAPDVARGRGTRLDRGSRRGLGGHAAHHPRAHRRV